MDAKAPEPRSGIGPGGPRGPGGGFRPGGPPGGMRGLHGRGGRDLTQGPIASTLIIFSLPMLGGNLLQSLNLTANQFWVAHLLGATDITAIGNANSVMFLMQSVIMGATMAANI